MSDRPILPLGSVLSSGFARHVAAYYRAEVEAEAERVAKALTAQGWQRVDISHAGVDFNPAQWTNGRPRTASPEHATVTLAIVHGERAWQESDYVLIEMAWDSGIVSCNRDVWDD